MKASDYQESFKEKFPSRLKLAFKRAKRQQTEFAREYGLHQSSISKWMRGKEMETGINLITALTLAKYLKVDPLWLFGLSDKEYGDMNSEYYVTITPILEKRLKEQTKELEQFEINEQTQRSLVALMRQELSVKAAEIERLSGFGQP